MNKYKCFYDNDEIIVESATSIKAQEGAFKVFSHKYPRRKIKQYQITPALIERDGAPINIMSNFV